MRRLCSTSAAAPPHTWPRSSSNPGRACRDLTPWRSTRAGSPPGARPPDQCPRRYRPCPARRCRCASRATGRATSSARPTQRAGQPHGAAPRCQRSAASSSPARRSRCASRSAQTAFSPRPIQRAATSAWTKTAIDQGSFLDAVSCPSVSLCVAGGGAATLHGGATILTSTDPTGGASSWSSAPVASGDEIVLRCRARRSRCAWLRPIRETSSPRPTRPAGPAPGRRPRSIRGTHGRHLVPVGLTVRRGRRHAHTDLDQPDRRARAPGRRPRSVTGTLRSLPTRSRARRFRYASQVGIGNVLTSTAPTGDASAWTNTAIDQAERRLRTFHARLSRCASPQTRAATSSPRPLRQAARMRGRSRRLTSQAARPSQPRAFTSSSTLVTIRGLGSSTPARPALGTRSAT